MSSLQVADYIARAISRQGIRHVFELSGGMITYLLDAIHRRGEVRLVSMRHEQAAAFAADGYGRMTGLPGVAMATSGPGATNLLTGIGSCYFDSTPAVFITGQVNRAEQKRDRPIRQLGFQETDIVAMVRPIVKRAWRIDAPEQIPQAIEDAFACALESRRGPVLLDIPMDVQKATIDDVDSAVACVSEKPDFDLASFRNAMENASRPLILAGGGIQSSGAIALFRRLVETAGIPVVHSLMAVDALPFGDPLRIGMIGTYGNRWANLALMRSDALIVIGSRLDVRQTGSRTEEFKGNRVVFHLDCEAGEINNRVADCVPILGDLRHSIPALAAALDGFHRLHDWEREIAGLRAEWPDVDELAGIAGVNPNRMMHQLSLLAREAAAYVADVGQHQMWAAQSLEIEAHQRFITAGGMGAMGFGLPASIGVALANPGRPVALIAGDGGFQCNIQELETVKNLGLPLKILLLNNGCHGMVRQFQESYFEGRYPSTYWGYSAPDFARVVCAYGIASSSVSEPEQVADALHWLWKSPLEPALLEVRIDTFAAAWPKVMFGKSLGEMEP